MSTKPASLLSALRAEIIAGDLPGGTRLKEEEIAARFGVSRVPVREALRQLESEGFAVAERYKGVTVADRSTHVVVELMQVRRGLEVMAAGLAADRRGGEVADELRTVVDRGARAGREHQIEALPPLILEFHQLVARASGNRQLEQLIDRLLEQTAWGFEQEIEERVDSSWRDHASIAAAVLDGSRMQASFLMDEHILKDETIFRRSFDSAPPAA